MAKYRVRRTFAASEPLHIGKIVEDPNWRNLGVLLRNGYLEEFEEAGEIAPVIEPPVEVENPVEPVIESPVEPVIPEAPAPAPKKSSKAKKPAAK